MTGDSDIVTINISMPHLLKRYVDSKVSSGGYGSASEFVREAIREKFQREQNRANVQGALAAKLLDGLDSGKPIPFTPNYFRGKKRSLAGRAAKKRA